jgi:predicted alpha/beta superfamily hydrolase
MKKIIVFLMALPLMSVAQQFKSEPIENGIRIKFNSRIMGEERTIWIRVPASYYEASSSTQTYPVIYVLDGKSAFFPVTGVVSFMSEEDHVNYQIPEMIVVGVDTENRFRDLTPIKSTKQANGEESKTPEQKLMMSGSGGGEQFLNFLKEEVFTYIEKNYRTNPFRIYVGHSLGGLTATYTFLKHPDLFNATISIDPSLWWDGAKYVNEAPELLKTMPKDQIRKYYVSVIDSSSYGGSLQFHTNAIFNIGKAMENVSSKNIQYKVDYIANTDHSSIPMLSWYNGLLFIFEGYHKSHFDYMKDPDLIESHFKEVESKIGLKMNPSQDIFKILVHYLTSPDRYPDAVKARKVLNMALKYYPASTYFQNKLKALDAKS